MWATVGPARLGPANIFNNNIILYIIKNKKKFESISDFSRVFLLILFNIRLYFYTVRYKSGIKILGFLRNFS